MMWKTLLLFACLLCAVRNASPREKSLDPEIFEKAIHPDVGLRVPELVARYNYSLETHQVTTTDGYILTLHRIPHGRNNTAEPNKPVVFLMHGLLCSSADWVLMGPEKGLAFLLADRGYDVWMGNARGNTYSRKHVTLDADRDKRKFWSFSWHEIGAIDIPQSLDYILETTSAEDLFYIGHSQGTTTFFVMTSTYPEYNDKIRLMIALAPVAYTEHTPNIGLKIVSKFSKTLTWVTNMLGSYEFLPSNEFMQIIGQALCNDNSPVQEVCSNILFLIAGYDSQQLNTTMLPVILSNTPAGSSTKQILHFTQEINSGKFRQYDYGALNILKYGRLTPPSYKLNRVNAPVVLIYGDNDLLSSKIDIDRLKHEIQNSVMYRVPYDRFNHLDFLWAIDVVPLVYNKVFDLLNMYK